VRVSKVGYYCIDRCTITAADKSSGHILLEAQQSQCGSNYEQLASRIYSISLLNFNQLFSGP